MVSSIKSAAGDGKPVEINKQHYNYHMAAGIPDVPYKNPDFP
jgi:hypothetical protein